MRGIRWLAGAATVLLLLCAARPGRAEETWYLRVIARDDTAAGQAEKQRVRDAVLSALPKRAADIPALLPRITREANRIAPCRVELRSWTPDEKHRPAPTVYVTVGGGQGHNLWGILYEDALLLAEMDGEEGTADQPVFVWPLWETLLRWLGLSGDQPPDSSVTMRRMPSSLDCIS